MTLLKKILTRIILLTKYTSEKKIKYLRKKGCIIGNNCYLYNKINDFGSEPYLVTLGNNCKITGTVRFITHDGGVEVLDNLGKTKKADKFGKIKIGDNVFIGINTTIMPNVNIGNNVIIGAQSLVTKDIPSNCVAAGHPAKHLMSIDEYYEKNKENIHETRGMSYKDKKEYLANIYKQ